MLIIQYYTDGINVSCDKSQGVVEGESGPCPGRRGAIFGPAWLHLRSVQAASKYFDEAEMV